jgi:hypothetical protein
VGEAEEIPLFFTLIPILALLSNYDRENCLINVGTEGGMDSLSLKLMWLPPTGTSSRREICWHRGPADTK